MLDHLSNLELDIITKHISWKDAMQLKTTCKGMNERVHLILKAPVLIQIMNIVSEHLWYFYLYTYGSKASKSCSVTVDSKTWIVKPGMFGDPSNKQFVFFNIRRFVLIMYDQRRRNPYAFPVRMLLPIVVINSSLFKAHPFELFTFVFLTKKLSDALQPFVLDPLLKIVIASQRF